MMFAYDAPSGSFLWSRSGSISGSFDVHHSYYTNELLFPCGPPRVHPASAPSILMVQRSSNVSRTDLVDSRTGTTIWSRDEAGESVGADFIPASVGKYDVLFRSNGGGGAVDMKRVDGATGQSQMWTQQYVHRRGLPIPDITGDQRYDLVTRANYSSSLIWLDGLTGAHLFTVNYGSFDVLGAELMPGMSEAPVDVVVAAQLSSAGGVRRYRANDGAVLWDSSPTYNNQTLIGTLRGANGTSVILSGWRHRGRCVAFDGATGVALWDDVPVADGDIGAIGATDLTGDGNEDVFSISAGMLRLYDGMTGEEQTWFPPLAASAPQGAALWMPCPYCLSHGSPSCAGDFNGDGVIDLGDLQLLLFNFGQVCP